MAVAVAVTIEELLDLGLIDFSVRHSTATAIFPFSLGTFNVLSAAVVLFHTSHSHFVLSRVRIISPF